ncbi:MAG TPA: cytochrome D1 domain-containing protein [Rhodocyclaceae bacterium]|nr:cytochrome D1 domain-containing protein [Rhodocyclaceae bacterium]
MLFWVTSCWAGAADVVDVAGLYATHCAGCHGADRFGGIGPALLPESLERLKRADAMEVIRHGRRASQMPAFAPQLGNEEIEALAGWIYRSAETVPTWSEADIRASRVQVTPAEALVARPVFKADPLNLFVVVEGGDHHVSIIDGDRLEVIHRFPSHYALHGGPKFSPDGRFVYFASRDGWITKFDLWSLKVVAEVRAGLNTRNAAVSGDGCYVAVANTLPRTLALFDADLNLIKVLPAMSLDGRQFSRVSAVYEAAPRHSFIAAMKDMPELWEISYDAKAAPIYDGHAHGYAMGEGIARPGFLNPRRIPLDEPLDDFFFDQDYRNLMGTARSGRGQVVNLDARRKIAELPLPGMPHLGSGITWKWQGRTVMASTNLKEGGVTVIDMSTWQPVKTIPTLGPGFFLRSHENSPYAFVDAMMSPARKDTLQVIDKRTLAVVADLRPEPGKTLAHVEFTRDGRYALASLWEQEGALIVFDARTLKEVKRIPMCRPVGKYNVWNKISRSEGTSH